MEKEILEKVLAQALKLLAKRPQSEGELKSKLTRFLKRKKIKEKNLYLLHVLQYLKEHNYLNDLEFSRWFINQRLQFRPRSKKALYFELKKKSLSNKIIKKALEDYNEEEACQKLAAKKASLPLKKLILYLRRQGFPYQLIEKITDSQLVSSPAHKRGLSGDFPCQSSQ